MDKHKLKKLIQAVVTLKKKSGRGVLVTGNLILTAAHCIEFDCSGSMIGDWFIESIETAEHQQFNLVPLAVEPVSDIAAGF